MPARAATATGPLWRGTGCQTCCRGPLGQNHGHGRRRRWRRRDPDGRGRDCQRGPGWPCSLPPLALEVGGDHCFHALLGATVGPQTLAGPKAIELQALGSGNPAGEHHLAAAAGAAGATGSGARVPLIQARFPLLIRARSSA